MDTKRRAYPSDVGDEEWAFVAAYLTLMKEDAPQRQHSLRDVFDGLRWIVRSGSEWRLMPHDLPPWHTVYQQTRRWLAAGVFEEIARDLRMLLREIEGRTPAPRAAVIDSRTLQSSPESGGRAGYDGAKRRKGSKVHMAVDTLGQLLALVVSPADEGDRAKVGELAEAVQEATGESVEVAFVDQGYTGERAGGGRGSARDTPRGGEAAAGEEGLRAAAAPLGSGALLRVVGALPQARPRLRAAAGDARGSAPARLLHAAT